MQEKHLVLQAFQSTFLKLFKNELSKSISLLANTPFINKLIFPNVLKTANVTPIFKTDDPVQCNI